MRRKNASALAGVGSAFAGGVGTGLGFRVAEDLWKSLGGRRKNPRLLNPADYLGRWTPTENPIRHSNPRTGKQPPRTPLNWEGTGLSARLFIGLNVGKYPRWEVSNVIKIVTAMRRNQAGSTNSTFITQHGVFEQEGVGRVDETSVQVVLFDEGATKRRGKGATLRYDWAPSPRVRWKRDMLDLARHLATKLCQDEVIVDLRDANVSWYTAGVKARSTATCRTALSQAAKRAKREAKRAANPRVMVVNPYTEEQYEVPIGYSDWGLMADWHKGQRDPLYAVMSRRGDRRDVVKMVVSAMELEGLKALVGEAGGSGDAARALGLRKHLAKARVVNPGRRNPRSRGRGGYTVPLGYSDLLLMSEWYRGMGDPLYAVMSKRGNSVDIVPTKLTAGEVEALVALTWEAEEDPDKRTKRMAVGLRKSLKKARKANPQKPAKPRTRKKAKPKTRAEYVSVYPKWGLYKPGQYVTMVGASGSLYLFQVTKDPYGWKAVYQKVRPNAKGDDVLPVGGAITFGFGIRTLAEGKKLAAKVIAAFKQGKVIRKRRLNPSGGKKVSGDRDHLLRYAEKQAGRKLTTSEVRQFDKLFREASTFHDGKVVEMVVGDAPDGSPLFLGGAGPLLQVDYQVVNQGSWRKGEWTHKAGDHGRTGKRTPPAWAAWDDKNRMVIVDTGGSRMRLKPTHGYVG